MKIHEHVDRGGDRTYVEHSTGLSEPFVIANVNKTNDQSVAVAFTDEDIVELINALLRKIRPGARP